MTGFERTGFRGTGDGITVRLEDIERSLLADLAEQLVSMLEDRAAESPADALFAQVGIGGPEAAPRDPALARLLPDAYRDDREAASEHRHLTERGLVERKVANARIVIATLGADAPLDGAAVQAWLRTLTDLRLIIAVRLGITADDDEGTGPPELQDVYGWLGYLQGSLIEELP